MTRAAETQFGDKNKLDNPVSLYAATKKSNELMAHAYSKLYNIPSTGLRFFTVYGPAGRPDMAYFGFTNKLLNGEMGMKDVGFGMTVQDKNAPDLVPLYQISNEMGMEFATASLHNSFYFVEAKNIIHDRPMVAKNFEKLVNELLRSNSPKKWFRAYFNHGLINYIYGQKRLLPCDMSFDTFFIDPYGDVMYCYICCINEKNWNDSINFRNIGDVSIRCTYTKDNARLNK